MSAADADEASWRARAERAEARAERAEARAVELEARVAELSEQVAVLSRMLFGRSSEKGEPAPDGEGKDAGAGADGAGGGSDGGGAGRRRGQRPGSRGHGRRDYSHLDTRQEVHEVPEGERTCTGCGTAFEPLGFDDSEQIDWRVVITRIVHRRRRYRRVCACPGGRTVVAPVPVKPIAKGRFTAGFLARLLVEKYVLGRPLHRIAMALAADGFQVAEGSLSGALKQVADLLAPLLARITARNAAAAHVHADETSWRVFEQVEDKQGTRWWLWVFVAEDTTCFVMDPTRSAKVLEQHFGITRADGALPQGRRLVLSSDFYSVYQSLAQIDGVHPLWCWAHIRRYFIRAGDAHTQLRLWRDQWIERIAVLYTAHRALAAAPLGSPEHQAAEQAFNQALADLDTARRQPRGPGLHPAAAKVLDTLDREWDGLARHRDFPDLPLDNYADIPIMPMLARKSLCSAAEASAMSA